MRTHSVSSMFDLLSLTTQIPQNVGANILRLERYPVRIVQSTGAILQSLGSLEQPLPLIAVVRVRVVGKWLVSTSAAEQLIPLAFPLGIFQAPLYFLQLRLGCVNARRVIASDRDGHRWELDFHLRDLEEVW